MFRTLLIVGTLALSAVGLTGCAYDDGDHHHRHRRSRFDGGYHRGHYDRHHHHGHHHRGYDYHPHRYRGRY